jgi:Domain of unknown function (DUF4365)
LWNVGNPSCRKDYFIPNVGGFRVMTYPIDKNEAKSRISEGCFFAIGSYARFKIVKCHLEDDSGVDFHLKKMVYRNGSISDGGIILDFQLKATERWKEENNCIKFALPTKNFNDMVERNLSGMHPIILIVMCLPREEAEWMYCSIEDISFRKNMFWYHTTEIKYISSENSTITLKIPKGNLLTHNRFKDLVNKYGTRRR